MRQKVLSYFTRPGSMAGAINFATALDRTHQEFKDECDINVLMRRYEATGVMPQPWKSPPVAQYGDFSEAPDYFEAQRILATARDQFSGLPSRVRARFNNDPAQLLAFVHDDANLEEARKLGLLRDQAPPAGPPPTPPDQGK